MSYRTYHKVLVIALPIALAVTAFLAAKLFLSFFSFPLCPSYRFAHVYCPGCGSTRSVIALLHGDILLALRQNISIPALFVVWLVYYTEFALKVFGRKVRFPLIHSKVFVALLITAWMAYFVIRNFIPQIAPVFI